MKHLFAVLALACAVASPSYAADAASAPVGKSQGHKLGACSKEAKAKGLKGEDRNKFLSACAKGDGPAAAPTQGQKLGACSKEAKAKGLKGEERNKFLSDCAKA